MQKGTADNNAASQSQTSITDKWQYFHHVQHGKNNDTNPQTSRNNQKALTCGHTNNFRTNLTNKQPVGHYTFTISKTRFVIYQVSSSYLTIGASIIEIHQFQSMTTNHKL